MIDISEPSFESLVRGYEQCSFLSQNAKANRREGIFSGIPSLVIPPCLD